MSDPASTASQRPARVRRRLRGIGLLGSTFLAAFGFLMGTAAPVMACSCAQPGPLREFATADTAIFSGTAGLRDDRGVPVEIEQWFWGLGAAPVVWLSRDSFHDGSSCGVAVPPPGSRWIWVTWLPDDRSDPVTGLCSPSAMLGTPEGDAMVAEAVAAFEAGTPPTPTAEPTPAAPIDATPQPVDPVADQRDLAVASIGAAVILASLGLFGGLFLVARRSSRSPDRS